MDGVAQLSPDERAELFRETAARKGIAGATIVEKDFWVCWALKCLFASEEHAPALIFKGATSLSKVFAVIQRFSEDIDLSIDRHNLGFGGDRDPQNVPSTKKRNRLLKELDHACARYVKGQLLPQLNQTLSATLGDDGWSIDVDSRDSQTLSFVYPHSLATGDYAGITYIRPSVRLEFGARAEHWPAAVHPITPYAAEEFPDLFSDPACQIKTLEAERTFWEKATLLHAEYNRSEVRTAPDRLSRHYYDLAMLARSPIRDRAVAQLDLLEAVSQHKARLFRAASARYEDAKPGSLRLFPHEELEKLLRTDYAKMGEMFFHDSPEFDEILMELRQLETTINESV